MGQELWHSTSPSREQGMGEPRGPQAVQTHTHITHTQVPGVQLHLLLQLRQELVVEGLELQGERKHTVLVEAGRARLGLHGLRTARDRLSEAQWG